MPAATRIPPQSGLAVQCARGSLLRITDVAGEQVADVFAVAAGDVREVLSSGRSIDYESTIAFTTGDRLWSNRSSVMFTIVEDTVGRHDFLLSPCSLEMFRILHRVEGEHASCFGNLQRALGAHGVEPDAIGTTFNAFMHVDVAADGRVRVLPPLSRAGDHLVLRAEMDLVVGVTACSAEQSNNGSFSPVDVEVVAP